MTKKVDINDLQVINSFYHELRRIRYYKLILIGHELGPDQAFDEYGQFIYDYWVDFSSYANYINTLNLEDWDNINSTLKDIQNDLANYTF